MTGNEIQINIANHPTGQCGYKKCTQVTDRMRIYHGRYATVKREFDERVMIDIDGERYRWSKCMFKAIRPNMFEGVCSYCGGGAGGSDASSLTIQDVRAASDTSMKEMMKDFTSSPFFSIGWDANYNLRLRQKPMDTLKTISGKSHAFRRVDESVHIDT